MGPKSKGSKSKTSQGQSPQSLSKVSHQDSNTPKWPPLEPVAPAMDLELKERLQDQILTVSSLWSKALCVKYVKFLSTLTLATTPGKPKKGEALRVNDRFQIDDPEFADRLWRETALQELVEQAAIDDKTLDEQQRRELWGGEVLGLNSNIRIYRYTKGQFFAQHYDDFNNVSFRKTSASDPSPARTTWTLLLYLTSPTSGCEGGETVFYPEAKNKHEAPPTPVVAELEMGMALLHRHGAECLLHEGREVTAGEKWVIRSDLCVKR